ncbi:MAG: strawberry notch family protein [Syntrophaceae bacterium]|nr:strawberry notch family protein [Syntrophaceae bacterium]
MEPSAGTGNIAIMAKNYKPGSIIVNELSPRRLELLKSLNFDRYFSEDAAQLHNILPKDVKPTVIVMNPPFSATAGRIAGKRQTIEGARHIEQALERLEQNGRLVAIVGEGMADDRSAFQSWWKKIKDKYAVRANIGISGKEYAKYGTTFDNQLLIIDKVDKKDYTIVNGKVDSVEDILPLIKGIRDDRISTREQKAIQSDLQEGTARSKAEPGPRTSVLPSISNVGDRGREGGSKVSGVEGEPRLDALSVATEKGHEVSGGRAQPNERLPRRKESASDSTSDIGSTGQPIERDTSGLSDTDRPANELQIKSKENEAKGELSEDLYESYKPERLEIAGAKRHPTPLVQSAAMSAVNPPLPTYKPSIPQQSIDKGHLSDIQLESIIYAGQSHEEKLPDGARRGFFIGDGTGVGKGREIAGIFWDNWNKGRKKGIWISEKRNLFADAKRDVEGTGWNSKLVFDHGKIKATEPIGASKGILFSTYDTLKSRPKDPRAKSRLDQVVDWLGEDFDGVIAFDESHNMGNAIAVRGERGTRQPSAKALAGVELQRRLPNARVVYVSATGATEVINLAYGDRLGLWGEGTAFPTKDSFIEQVSAGGMAAMELVARDMKSIGVYNARSLSYDGVVTDRIEHELSNEQRKIYNDLSDAWQVVLQNINTALKVCGAVNENTGKAINGHAKAAAYSAFWGAHQRFFNQIITSMQTPSVINAIHEDIKNGDAVVVQLVNTMEAAQERALSKLTEEDSLEDLDLTPRDSLMQLVQHSFPVAQYEQYRDEDGNIRSRMVVDSKGNPVENARAVQMREELLDQLGSIKVPDSPIDMIIEEFGYKNVAEVTGRRRRVISSETKAGTIEKVIEKRSRTKAAADADAFMNDKKRILIFSEAGGTGRSYHADLNAKNQRKRVHYLLQAGWRADKAVQGLGRTHRSNQKQPPVYYLVTTDLKGQKRFISSIARRLDQLGALTKGQRQAGSQGIFQARDNLESDYAKDALRILYEDLYRSRVETISIFDFESQTGLRLRDDKGNMIQDLPPIRQFLNRLLSLNIETMNNVFDEFSKRMDDVIAAHVEAGTLDQGLETLKADKVEKVREEIVRIDERSGAETKYVELDVTNPMPIMSYSVAKNYAKAGFWQNVKSGKVWAANRKTVTNRKSGALEDLYILKSITYGENRIKEEDFSEEKWRKLSNEESKELWAKSIDETPKTFTRKEHLITGTLLPIWDRLHGHPRIMRVQTSDGERMIGRLIPPSELATTLKNIGAEASKIEITPEEIAHQILDQGGTVELANGWKIVRRRVSGDDRIEIKGPGYDDFKILEKYGVFSERINWETRYFIPASEQGVSTIESIIKNHPVVSMTGQSVGDSIDRLKEGLLDERGSISFQKIKRQPLYDDLLIVSKHYLSKGYTSFKDFSAQMKRVFSDIWEKIKKVMMAVWTDAKQRLKDERGSISIAPKKTPASMQSPKALTTEQWLREVVKKKGLDEKAIRKERQEFNKIEDEAIESIHKKPPKILKLAVFEKSGKPDINPLDPILGTPLHYSNKVPTYKRLRIRASEKVDIQNEMVDRLTQDQTDKSGKTYYTKTINLAKKKDPKGYKVYKNYRNWQDREQYGYRVKPDADTGKFMVYAPGEIRSIKQFLTMTDAKKAGYGVAKRKGINPDLVTFAVSGNKWRFYLPKNLKPVSSFMDESIAWEDALQRELKDFKDTYNPSDYVMEALEADKRIVNNGFNVLMQGMRDLIQWYESRGLELPSEVEIINGEEIKVNLRTALVQMGDRRGYYFPRNRNQGKFMLKAEQKGKSPHLEFFDLAAPPKREDYTTLGSLLLSGTPIGKRIKELQRQGFKRKNIVVKKAIRPLEDIFLDGVGRVIDRQTEINDALDRIKAGEINLEKLNLSFIDRRFGPGRRDFAVTGPTNKAQHEIMKTMGGRWYSMSPGEPKMWHFQNPGKNFERRLAKALITVSEHIDLEAMHTFAKALTESLSDLEKSRGHRAHMIARVAYRGKDVYRGYEEDPSIAISSYAAGIAGGEAKKTMALDMIKIFLGTDIGWYQFQAIKQYRGTFDQYMDDYRQAKDFEGSFNEYEKLYSDTRIDSLELFSFFQASDREIERDDFDFINDPDAFEANQNKIMGIKEEGDEEELSKAYTWLYDEYLKTIEDRKISDTKQANAYRDAKAYIRENLRNDEFMDRVMGTIKGVAVLKYLAGRVSAPIVNLTALPTVTPAAMNVYADIPITEAGKYIVSGIRTYGNFSLRRTEKLSEDDLWALKQIKAKKWDAPKFNREALTALESKLGRTWNDIIEAGMIGFGMSEQLNRGATIMGAYKAIRANKPNMNKEEALKLAKEVSDQAHSVYNKSNWPSWVRGSGVGANVARAFYIFKSFSHNYLQLMKDAHGPGILRIPEHKAAFGWLAVSPAIIAGTGALVGKELLFAMLKAFGLGGDDPEEAFYGFVSSSIGEKAEDIARYGAMGIFGVNLKGSLEIGITDIPTNLVDLLGAPGSMLIKDPIDMMTAIKRGNYLKATEKIPIMPLFLSNPIKAYREFSQGVTTWTNTPVFYGNRQLMADKSDAVARFLSFNPVGISSAREKQWAETQIEQKYKDWKTDIYAKAKAYYGKPHEKRNMEDWTEIIAEIKEFNDRVSRRNIKGVSLITSTSLKGVIRRMYVPPKKERMRR